MKWSEVVADPEFQELPESEKAQWQQDYFNEVVVPQLGPNENQSEVYGEFYLDTKDTITPPTKAFLPQTKTYPEPVLHPREAFGVDPKEPSVPQDGADRDKSLNFGRLGGALKKELIENAPERMGMIAGGLAHAAGTPATEQLQSRAEEFLKIKDPSVMDRLSASMDMAPLIMAGKFEKFAGPKLMKLKKGMVEWGHELFKESKAEVEANQPEGLNSLETFIVDVARGFEDMVPALGVGAITRMPALSAGIITGQVYGQTYGDSRDMGLTPAQSTARAKFHSIAEGLPEMIPFTAILKRGSKITKKYLEGVLGEGAQEMITEIMQNAYDDVELENMSLKDALMNIDWKKVAYAGATGMGVGLGMTSTMHAVDTAEAKYRARKLSKTNKTIKGRLDSLNTMMDELTEAENNNAIENEIEARSREIEEEEAKLKAEVGAAWTFYEEENKDKKTVDEEKALAEINKKTVVPADLEPAAPTTPGQIEQSLDAEKAEREISGKPKSAMEAAFETAKPAKKYGLSIDEAATQVDTAPTEAQKESGNYRKGHTKIQGMDVAIENPKGSIRKGTDESGKEWSQKMDAHYGYIKRTQGADGDHVDVFLGPDAKTADTFYVVNQVNPKTRKFNEHKVMIGFPDQKTAKAAYMKNYAKGWKGFDSIVPLTTEQFKRFVHSNKTKKALPDSAAILLSRGKKKVMPVQKKMPTPNLMDMESNPEYQAEKKGRQFAKETMTPDEYMQKVASGFGNTVQDNINDTLPNLVEEYAVAMKRGDKFPILTLDYTDGFSQEGRHRALAAKKAGFTHVPVAVITKPAKAIGSSKLSKKASKISSKENIEKYIKPIAASWKNGPKIEVVKNYKELPDNLITYLKSEKAENETDGLFDPETETVYLIADRISNKKHAQTVLLHEAIGHYGLRELLGNSLKPLLNQVYKAKKNSKLFKDIVLRYDINLRTVEGRLQAAEEWLANTAELNPRSMWVQRAVAKFRQWIRKVFKNLQVTDTELAGLIGNMNKAVRNGTALPRNAPFRALLSKTKVSSRNKASIAKVSEESQDGAWDAYKKKANAVIGKLDAMIDGYSGMADLNSFLEIRMKTQGRIGKSEELAKKLYGVFSKLNKADSNIVYEYLTDRDADPKTIKDIGTRSRAITAKKMVNKIGEELVHYGLIPAKSRQKYKDRYLPRLYLAYMLGDKAISAVGKGKALSDMGFTKKRNEELSKEYRDIILGEIKDPGFLLAKAVSAPMRDMAIIDFFQDIASNKNWVLQDQMVEITVPGTTTKKKVTSFWLKNEASRLREMTNFTNDESNKKILAVANNYDKLSVVMRGKLSNYNHEDFRQIPDTPRYGAVRGLIVNKHVYDDLLGVMHSAPDNASAVQKFFDYGGTGTTLTKAWKIAHVPLNPPSQIRNLASNMILVNLSGVHAHKMPQLLARAAREIYMGKFKGKRGKYYNIAEEYGLLSGTFAANELLRIESELTDMAAKEKGAISIASFNNIAGKIVNISGDAYQMFEMLGKTMIMMHEIEVNKSTELDAAIKANKWLFDYSAVNQSIRYLRNAPIGSPFLTFYIKVLPRLLEVAATAPWRFLPYYLMLKSFSAAVALMNDVDDDDVEKLKEALPSWLNEMGGTIIWPWKDKSGRWQAFNLGYFFPWTMWTDAVQDVKVLAGSAVAGGTYIDEEINLFSASGMFGGPIPQMITAITTNKDPFTKKEIINKNSPSHYMAADAVNYLYTMMAPPWLTERGVAGKMITAYNGDVHKYDQPMPTMSQAALRGIGLNVYPIEPESSRDTNLFFREMDIKALNMALDKELSNPNITDKEMDVLIKDYGVLRDQMLEAMDRYIERSEVHPNLKTGH